ncbi:hypothetical protein Taro_051504 [Colocasia esculenta]|uniref:Uncharacterized protein n=1 Tax=Colocasia esculenta TaxID=4460 RepID=A0A843XG87_COLES|nr:hypothetical protein [Colocasia esculenta]
MADKHFSIILTVDLSCGKCHDKIKKVLSKYEDRWNIRSVVWDEKNNKITLTGPFCPDKLSKKLCKKACKVIKSYDIPDHCDCNKEKPKPKPAPAKPAEPKKDPPKPETPKPAAAKPAEPKKDPPKPENPKPAAPAPAPKPEAAPAPPKADKPAPSPPQPKPAEPAPVAVPDPYPPVWPVCFGGPWCQCGAGGGYAPWGCNCGCGYGHGGCSHGCGGRPCHAGCKVEFFCEDDSSCRPM